MNYGAFTTNITPMLSDNELLVEGRIDSLKSFKLSVSYAICVLKKATVRSSDTSIRVNVSIVHARFLESSLVTLQPWTTQRNLFITWK